MIDMTEEQRASLLDSSIPGESLTQDPENPQAYEKPAEYDKLEDFMDSLFMNISNEDNLSGILDAMRKEVPVEDVAQMLLFNAFASGKINVDIQLLAIEPTIYMLLGLAEYAGVNPVLYPEDDMVDDDDEVLDELEQEASFEEMEVPEGISKSLLSKIKEGDTDGD